MHGLYWLTCICEAICDKMQVFIDWLPKLMNTKMCPKIHSYDDNCEHATTEIVCRNYVVVLSCGSYPAPAYLCDGTCCRYWSCSFDGGYEPKASAAMYAEVLLECDRYVRIPSMGHVISTRKNDDIMI
jgi:hypothetical protein